MKKLLLTIFISFTLFGSMFAQTNAPYESHWPFNSNPYEMSSGLVAAIMIDGEIITADYSSWDALEVAAFIGEGDEEEVRGNDMYLYNGYVEEYGDEFPVIDGMPIFYMLAVTGDKVHFKMYDHINEIEYTNCTILYLGEEFNIYTGDDDHLEGWFEPENPIFLSFTTPGFEKEIKAYSGEKDRYYLIASPIGEVAPDKVKFMLNNDYDLYYFDQSNTVDGELKEWVNHEGSNGGFNLEVGKGYLYANSETVTLKFMGTGYTGNVEKTLDKANGVRMSGWNLVGNPYGEEVYIDRPFYRMNHSGTAINSETETGVINPMEGVFVMAEEDGETLTFTTEAPSKSPKLALNLTQENDVIDRAILRFDEGKELQKFQFLKNSTKVYIPVVGEDYAVVRSEAMGEMPVNFKAEKNGSYTISFNNDNVEFSYLHLIDNLTGNDVDLLANPSYSFEAKATDYANRFKLVYTTATTANNDEFAFISNNHLMILGVDGQATLKVMDVTGRTLSTETFSGNYDKALNMSNGVYMLQLIQGGNVKTQKIVVK